VIRTNRRNGIALIEMLYILALMGIVGLMSGKLFVASMRVIGSAPQSQDRSARVDRMTDFLRKDVWGAMKIDCAPGAVVLTQADGSAIRWRFSYEGAARIGGDLVEQRWSIERMHVESGGATLRLTSSSAPDAPMEFVSQLMTINGAGQ